MIPTASIKRALRNLEHKRAIRLLIVNAKDSTDQEKILAHEQGEIDARAIGDIRTFLAMAEAAPRSGEVGR